MHTLERFDTVKHETLVPPDVFNTDEVSEARGGPGAGLGGVGARPRQRVRLGVARLKSSRVGGAVIDVWVVAMSTHVASD